jgi:hypothetical protein
MPRCADGSNDRILCHMNLSYRVYFILLHAMATATSKWLRQQHLLAAISSSFTSCRPKATTNGEEMSARHIASRDGNNDLSCACTHIVSHGGDYDNASRDYNDFNRIDFIFIVSRNGDSNNYWQQRTTSVGRRGLVHEHTTYSHRVAR